MTPQGAWLQTSAPLVSPIDPGSHLGVGLARVRTHQRIGVNFGSGVSSEELRSQLCFCLPRFMPVAHRHGSGSVTYNSEAQLCRSYCLGHAGRE